jgi:hypothetical protein
MRGLVSGKQIVVVGLIALVTVMGAVRLWPGDERAIRKQLTLIETVGSKALAEQPVEGLLKATQLAGLFSDPCRLTVTSATHAVDSSRKQIQERIVLARTWYNQLNVSLHDVTLVFAENKTAVVRGTIRLRGEGAGEQGADVQEFRAEMRPINGKWLLTAVEIVEVLER